MEILWFAPTMVLRRNEGGRPAIGHNGSSRNPISVENLEKITWYSVEVQRAPPVGHWKKHPPLWPRVKLAPLANLSMATKSYWIQRPMASITGWCMAQIRYHFDFNRGAKADCLPSHLSRLLSVPVEPGSHSQKTPSKWETKPETDWTNQIFINILNIL